MVRVDAKILLEAVQTPTEKEIVLTAGPRDCLHLNVQNVRLVATKATPQMMMNGHSGSGWNLVNVYMGEGLNGLANAPTVFRVDTLPFQYIPPAQKSPSGPYVTLAQTDLTTLVTN
jgi:hypothetical protein